MEVGHSSHHRKRKHIAFQGFWNNNFQHKNNYLNNSTRKSYDLKSFCRVSVDHTIEKEMLFGMNHPYASHPSPLCKKEFRNEKN